MEYVAVVLQGAGVYCVPADDHCLYYALLHYLIKHEKVLPSVDVRQLRKILADYLLANGENICIAGDPITEWLPKVGTTLEQHCEVTRRGIGGEICWAGDFELATVARIYGINVHVFAHAPANAPYEFYRKAYYPAPTASCCNIFLLHSHDNHFDVLKTSLDAFVQRGNASLLAVPAPAPFQGLGAMYWAPRVLSALSAPGSDPEAWTTVRHGTASPEKPSAPARAVGVAAVLPPKGQFDILGAESDEDEDAAADEEDDADETPQPPPIATSAGRGSKRKRKRDRKRGRASTRGSDLGDRRKRGGGGPCDDHVHDTPPPPHGDEPQPPPHDDSPSPSPSPPSGSAAQPSQRVGSPSPLGNERPPSPPQDVGNDDHMDTSAPPQSRRHRADASMAWLVESNRRHTSTPRC